LTRVKCGAQHPPVATVGSDRDTGGRILDVAWRLVAERGAADLTLADVAAAAGVSRQTVYLHVGSRAGLFVAMARRYDEAHGFPERIDRARALPPVEALEAHVRTWFAYVEEILPVARALEAATVTGGDGAAAWEDRMRGWWGCLRAAVERVAGDGRLAEGWTVDTATDWLWAQVHVARWQHLVVERGWDRSELVERTLASLRRDLVAGRRRARA
jgi:AcrR family transcriptional regulator